MEKHTPSFFTSVENLYNHYGKTKSTFYLVMMFVAAFVLSFLVFALKTAVILLVVKYLGFWYGVGFITAYKMILKMNNEYGKYQQEEKFKKLFKKGE